MSKVVRFQIQPHLSPLSSLTAPISSRYSNNFVKLNKHQFSLNSNSPPPPPPPPTSRTNNSSNDSNNFTDHEYDDDGGVVHGSRGGGRRTNNKLLKKLRRYGISGILSYGLLNTAYYTTTFSFVWFYVAPAPGRLGYAAAVERFLKVMAMVWIGSQVTKLARAAGALALAPLVSRGLTWFTKKYKFESEGKAFLAIVGVCIGVALLLFFVLTLLWA